MSAGSWISIGFILIISIERYLGIVHSMKRHLRRRKVIYGCIAANIFLALVIGIPSMVYTDIDTYEVCVLPAGSTTLPYRWFIMIIYMIIPVIVVTWCYIKIIRFLTMQR